MFKPHLKLHDEEVVDYKKAKRIIALAFFLFIASAPAQAQTNWVAGTAYGTNDLSTATNITSVVDGSGSLIIGFPGTSGLTVSNAIQGSISITNDFSAFTLDAVNGTVTNGADRGYVLQVDGGSNLTVKGGRFVGTAPRGGSNPLYPNQTITPAIGGILRNTTDATINNGTFVGGDGLPALLLDTSSVTISNGSFGGGVDTAGAPALFATNSIITIDGDATFTGGSTNAAVHIRNTDLTIHGGMLQGGSFGSERYFGLASVVTAGQTNRISLLGGTVNSIDFAGGGIQYITMDSGLTVEDYVILDGGTAIVSNLADAPLQDVLIREGSMQLIDGFTLSPGGRFVLASPSSHAGFSALNISSNSSLWVGEGSVDVGADFSLAGGGTMIFTIVTNTSGILSADKALFETNAAIQVDATAAAFTQGTNTVELVTTINGISVVASDASTNSATSANLTENLDITAYTSGRTTLSDIFSDGGSNIAFRFTTQSLADYWAVDGQMAALADELEGNSQMALLIDQYGDPDASARAVEQTYFTTFNNLQATLQGMRSAVGQSISRSSEFRNQIKLIPPGAKGPAHNNQLRGWVKYYGQLLTHDQDGINPEYDTVLHGGVLGIDTSVGNLLMGASGGSGRYRVDYDSNARSDTVAYHGNLYGTYAMGKGYLDGGLAYGRNQVDTQTADPFVLEGTFDSDLAMAYFGGGYDLIDTKGGTIFTPEATLHYSMYQQDAYTEKSGTAVPRNFEEFDADSLLTSLGMNVSMLNTLRFDTFGIKVDGRLHWMHEFMADPSNMKFILEGGSNEYQLSYPGLDEDIYRIGIGATFFNSKRYQPKNVMFSVNFDELFGDGFSSHYVSGKVVYAF